jgi:hypothetical protein
MSNRRWRLEYERPRRRSDSMPRWLEQVQVWLLAATVGVPAIFVVAGALVLLLRAC